jgi:type I site-specific restriction-modification system R (restriction) subunit
MRSVYFLDASAAERNDFHVVDQYQGRNADGEVFRPDLLLFVNGLPLAIIECKASHHRLDEALTQLNGYQRSFAEQFVFNQVCVGLNRREGRYGDSTGLGNPTVLVLTDCKDLDKQIFDTFHAVGIRAIQAVSVDGLVKLLGNDYGSVFTSTVHKFQESEAAPKAEYGSHLKMVLLQFLTP